MNPTVNNKRRVSGMAGSSGCRSLDEDMAFDILSRLPVKSLLRFKCTCKRWCGVIENPCFITKHYNKATNIRLLVWNDNYPNSNHLPSLDKETLDPIENNVDMGLPTNSLPRPRVVMSPCNGIVCFHRDWDGIMLWNSATRDSRFLQMYCRWILVGFGFDSKTNDFKVIGFIENCNFASIIIYTLSNDTWREITVDDAVAMQKAWCADALSGTYADGSFHWLSSGHGDEDSTVILSFDTTNELFRKTAWEDIDPRLRLDNVTIWYVLSYKESLALILSRFIGLDQNFELWVADDYRIMESWTKKFVIGLSDLPDDCRVNNRWSPYFSPLVFWGDNRLLLRNVSSMVSCSIIMDMSTKETEVIKTRWDNNGRPKHVFVYVESLFPLGRQ